MDEDELWTRWKALWERVSPRQDESPVAVLFNQLRGAYALYQGREYHNLDHIGYCLEMLDTYRKLAQDPDAIEVALWYHDIVYEVRKRPKILPSHEALSAQFADRRLAGMDVEIDFREKVAGLIMATTHESCNIRTKDQTFIADIDWSPVGWSWEAFEQNREKIRQEYAHLSDTEFKAERIKWIESALKRESQFYLPAFKDRFEARAIDNITRELEFLAA